MSDEDFAGLLTQTIEHAATLEAENDSAVELERPTPPACTCPPSPTAIDLGALYELAGVLAEQGVK